MIIGNINNTEYPAESSLEDIKKALEYLNKADFNILENKKYIITNRISVIISEYETLPKIEKKAESHKKNIDIHYIISGGEIMGVGFENSENKICGDYNSENDCTFYSDVKDEKEIKLYEGDYAVFCPGEIHRPGCISTEKSFVRKAVMKIFIAPIGSNTP